MELRPFSFDSIFRAILCEIVREMAVRMRRSEFEQSARNFLSPLSPRIFETLRSLSFACAVTYARFLLESRRRTREYYHYSLH